MIPIDAYISHIKDDKKNTIQDYLYNISNLIDNSRYVKGFVDMFYRNEYKNATYVPRVTDTNVTAIDNDYVSISVDIRDDSLVTVEYDDGIPTYDGRPFIVSDVNGVYRLYKNVSNPTTHRDGMILYERVSKLGIPNKINEYNINEPDMDSFISINNYKIKPRAKSGAATKSEQTSQSNPPSDKAAEEREASCSI
jgi:hypothetical protein